MVSPITPPSDAPASVDNAEEKTTQEMGISAEEQGILDTANCLIKPIVEELGLKLKTASDLSKMANLPIMQVLVMHLKEQCQENVEALEIASNEEKVVMDHVANAAYELAVQVGEATGDIFSMTDEEKLIATQAYGYPSVVGLTETLIEEAPVFVRKLTYVYPQSSS
ncbi:MAG: hypothetical protein ACI8RA_003053 [Chlamydiales bacterium]|jgi:hypothetical protein